jgi:DNA (cytosine-5)-methyltransferase 1
MGYHRAGFEVVGVDIKPQPRYPFTFIQADALEYCREHGREYDAIHASPPCQAYSAANNIHGRTDHPDLIDATREALMAAGRPYVIENVPGAPLRDPALVCGLSLGLNVKRHRLFESSGLLLLGTPCGDHAGDWLCVFGNSCRGRCHVSGRAKGGGPRCLRPTLPTDRCRDAMRIEWMNRNELSQAIPPAYTEYIGRQLILSVSQFPEKGAK